MAVAATEGLCSAVNLASGLRVEDAQKAAFASVVRDLHVTCRHVVASQFDGIIVSIEPDGALLDCVGRIALMSAVRGRIISHPPGRLVIGAASDDATPIDDQPELDGATIAGVYVDSQSVRKVLNAASSAAQFDLAPDGSSELLGSVALSTRLQVAERLHALLLERARNPHTVDAAKAALLEARRGRVRGANSDFILLSLSRLFGYGQSVIRPVVVWALVVAIILVHRLIAALDDHRGFIRSAPLHIQVDHAMWVKAGDTLLSTLLLPANWVRLQEAAPAVGLSGGYLSAARLFLLILVLLFLAAARRRLRVAR